MVNAIETLRDWHVRLERLRDGMISEARAKGVELEPRGLDALIHDVERAWQDAVRVEARETPRAIPVASGTFPVPERRIPRDLARELVPSTWGTR